MYNDWLYWQDMAFIDGSMARLVLEFVMPFGLVHFHQNIASDLVGGLWMRVTAIIMCLSIR